ncbi:uncharacterized protein ARMOST_00355 [Armillaria ostoyae]|uniref:Guanine nucleotide-binding protein alpha-4 subunit n=2 Tax=Armillaria TaxID=47424 RepID=A0A284QKZ4_ARMOS|nr:guanine nucleotide binding protein, alpha subunit [Armillaria borealis]SJK97105.1 uncharacterized protein ARMOST_00355 [Armillaria ostoyae]
MTVDPFAVSTKPTAESLAIDESIRLERKRLKDNPVVKVLLLGQSESGKSTVIKNFRLAHDAASFRAERASWRSVIQLNLIRSVGIILDALDDIEQLPPDLRLLRLRLIPLRRVETDLRRRLSDSTTPVTPELSVRSLAQLSHSPDPISLLRESADAQDVITSLREDIRHLWLDERVRNALRRKGIRVEEGAGFFLNDLDRIAISSYTPSDDDVLRARLRTMGVQEWRIPFPPAPGQHPTFSQPWALYDVGGARTQRRAWLPFFDGVNAIIFLAPLSPFDTPLPEDPSVTHLDDTLALWHAITSTPLLARSTLIVFLNKCDLLKRKLKSGVRWGDWVRGYKGEEEVGAVVKWTRDRFREIARTKSPPAAKGRTTYVYPTSVTDTKATAVTLKSVRDGILREHLKMAEFV